MTPDAQAMLVEFLLMKEIPGLTYQDIQRMKAEEVGIFLTLAQEWNRMEKEAAEKVRRETR